jgi:hypothetical protein
MESNMDIDEREYQYGASFFSNFLMEASGEHPR